MPPPLWRYLCVFDWCGWRGCGRLWLVVQAAFSEAVQSGCWGEVGTEANESSLSGRTDLRAGQRCLELTRMQNEYSVVEKYEKGAALFEAGNDGDVLESGGGDRAAEGDVSCPHCPCCPLYGS